MKTQQRTIYCQQTELGQSKAENRSEFLIFTCSVCLFFINLFGSRWVLETLLMKFSILRQSRGETDRRASEFHSRGNERPAERGNVPSVNRPTLQSYSLLLSPVSYKQHILLPWVGWQAVYFQNAIQHKYIRFGGEKHQCLKYIIQCFF